MTSTDTSSALLLASQRVIFIGGLPDGATESLVRASMIPFGEIKSVDVVRLYNNPTEVCFAPTSFGTQLFVLLLSFYHTLLPLSF